VARRKRARSSDGGNMSHRWRMAVMNGGTYAGRFAPLAPPGHCDALVGNCVAAAGEQPACFTPRCRHAAFTAPFCLRGALPHNPTRGTARKLPSCSVLLKGDEGQTRGVCACDAVAQVLCAGGAARSLRVHFSASCAAASPSPRLWTETQHGLLFNSSGMTGFMLHAMPSLHIYIKGRQIFLRLCMCHGAPFGGREERKNHQPSLSVPSFSLSILSGLKLTCCTLKLLLTFSLSLSFAV